eukprot:COSAG02_NODE_371_length_23642_cov_21.655227_8_plen_60_part_00
MECSPVCAAALEAVGGGDERGDCNAQPRTQELRAPRLFSLGVQQPIPRNDTGHKAPCAL